MLNVGNYELPENFGGQVLELKLSFSNNVSIALDHLDAFDGSIWKKGFCLDRAFEIYGDLEEEPAYHFYGLGETAGLKSVPFEVGYNKGCVVRLFNATTADELLTAINESFPFSCWDEDELVKAMNKEEPEKFFDATKIGEEFTLHGALALVKNAKQTYAQIQEKLREKLAACFKEKGDLKHVEMKVWTAETVILPAICRGLSVVLGDEKGMDGQTAFQILFKISSENLWDELKKIEAFNQMSEQAFSAMYDELMDENKELKHQAAPVKVTFVFEQERLQDVVIE